MTDPNSDPHHLEPGHAATPFSAAQIRAGCPMGRTIRLLVEDEEGRRRRRVIRFVNCDEDGATQEMWEEGADGKADGPTTTKRSSWVDLQAHASFPVENTTISRETLDTPLGLLSCLRYLVEDGQSIDTFWFAEDLPGMPVKVRSESKDGSGSTVLMISSDLSH